MYSDADLARLKDAARAAGWAQIIAALGGVPIEHLDGRGHPCPKCGGTDRFSLMRPEEGALICRHCFHVKNGDGLAALAWLRGDKFPGIVALLARHLGIELESGPAADAPAPRRGRPQALELEDLSDLDAVMFCRLKGGISPAALRAFGARRGTWRGQPVIVIPIIAPGGAGVGGPPGSRGWAMYDLRAGTLQTRKGPVKVRTTDGARAGWLGEDGPARLRAAAWALKVEGLSDALALWSAIPERERGRFAIMSNAFGAAEKPSEYLADLRGKKVAIFADCDAAGERGAQTWAAAAAQVAAEVRIVRLPEGQWKDVRDYLMVPGHSGADLVKLIAAAPTVEAGTEIDTAAPTDPIRLAHDYVRATGGKIACWRQKLFSWEHGAWRLTTTEDVRSSLVFFLRARVRAIWEEELALAQEKGKDPGHPVPLGNALVNAVLSRVADLAGVHGGVDWGSEIPLIDGGRKILEHTRRSWVAFRNGILDLDALLDHGDTRLRSLSPTFWSQNVLPYDFDAEARPGRYWLSVLERNLGGEVAKIELLQEWFGYCLLPDTTLQKFMFILGEGANGKSVICAALTALLGRDNCSHVALETFGERFGLLGTLGKLANLTTDAAELDRVAEGRLKQFVCGEELTIDRKGVEPITAAPTARLTLAANSMPRFRDKSDGIWRRMLLLSMDRVVPEGDRVAGMDQPRWWLEGPGAAEMPGLFMWAIDGWARLRARGRFSVSDEALAEIEEHRLEANPAREFLVENYRERPGAWVRADNMYLEYTKWCESNGYQPLGNRSFGKELRRIFKSAIRKYMGPRSSRFWGYLNISGYLEPEELTD